MPGRIVVHLVSLGSLPPVGHRKSLRTAKHSLCFVVDWSSSSDYLLCRLSILLFLRPAEHAAIIAAYSCFSRRWLFADLMLDDVFRQLPFPFDETTSPSFWTWAKRLDYVTLCFSFVGTTETGTIVNNTLEPQPFYRSIPYCLCCLSRDQYHVQDTSTCSCVQRTVITTGFSSVLHRYVLANV